MSVGLRRAAKPEPEPAAGAAGLGPLSDADAAKFQKYAARIADSVNGFMQGKAEVVNLALVCLLAEGHLLLEDVPGVGKTSLARCLASAMGTPWQRIQFTPDLLPGDVTGVSVFHQDSNTFVFHKGPVFTNIVLADEVNRASPRTQSALLEVMEERTVTVDGNPNRVPRPFMVMATQNPVEMDGTYPLPEAQIDRFLIKTDVGYPDHASEVRVLVAEHSGGGVADVAKVSSAGQVERLVAAARTVHVSPSILEYIASLVGYTRQMPELRLGSSPRGAIGLLRASRVAAALEGRTFVVPSDVQALAGPVLAHRLLVSPSHEAAGGTSNDAVREAVSAVPAPPGDGQR
jgi:MoxR-like ATPase